MCVAVTVNQRVVYAVGSGLIHGFASSAKPPLGDSLAGDVIDHEQSLSGERKHGTFFACWNLCNKSVGAVVTFLVGVVLEAVDFVPNQRVQTPATRVAILAFFAFLPMVGLSLAGLAMAHFSLDEKEHALAMATIVSRNDAEKRARGAPGIDGAAPKRPQVLL